MHNDESWPAYEANLQAYRTNFLLSQSVMLAVGAIIMDKSLLALLLVAIISVFQICYIWIPVIYYRALLVDFHKHGLGERFDDRGDPLDENSRSKLTELSYCKNIEVRKKVNLYLSEEVVRERPFRNLRTTRKKMDAVLPVSMLLIWGVYLLYAFGRI